MNIGFGDFWPFNWPAAGEKYLNITTHASLPSGSQIKVTYEYVA